MSAMESEKENIAEGMVIDVLDAKSTDPPSKPPKKKSRSVSIGPGGLEAPLKVDAGNRRKSAFIPAVKSILTTKEDEAKRRDARRKSLANRRVSFAPEATLHTWDVIEYLKDATTSSTSPNSTRRVSSIPHSPNVKYGTSAGESPTVTSDGNEDAIERRTGAGIAFDGSPSPSRKPSKQRALRRRSSGIPPMNFNNPDDVFSSSPTGNQSVAGSDVTDMNISEGDNTNIGLEVVDATKRSVLSNESNDSTGSSARLDEALRLAAIQAGTRGINFDENGDESMEMAEDDITASFKPWAYRSGSNAGPDADQLLIEQEDLLVGHSTAMSSLGHNQAKESAQSTDLLGLLDQDASSGGEDMTMELTTAIGGIKGANGNTTTARSSNKRRRSSTTKILDDSNGSPTRKRLFLGRKDRRRSSAEDSSLGEETMDLTTAVGAIQYPLLEQDEGRSSIDASFGEEIMDFATIVGGIKEIAPAIETANAVDEENDPNEELTMELTTVLGEIKNREAPAPSSSEPTTSASNKGSPTRIASQPQPAIMPLVAVSPSPRVTPKQRIATPQKSPRKSPRISAVSPRQNGVPTTPRSPKVSGKEVFSVEKPLKKETPKELNQHAPSKAPPKMDMPSPSVKRQGSRLRSSPTRADVVRTPQKSTSNRNTAALSENIKLLATPTRKHIQTSPTKKTLTPKKGPAPATPRLERTPKQVGSSLKFSTPTRISRSASPAKSGAPASANRNEIHTVKQEAEGEEADVERIHLRDFLNMTSIRFMDLSTTKRRHTVVPPAETAALTDARDDATGLEDYVAAAACTIPILELYQHSCHELKKYIAGGKDVVRAIEESTYEENPAIFREYLSAPNEEKHIMDNQFKNMKTNARLLSKAMWYEWRSKLLDGLKEGLGRFGEDFDKDDATLRKQEELLAEHLPELIARHKELEDECRQFKARAEELEGPDREELNAARDRILSADAEIEEKKQLLLELQRETREKEAAIELVKERKMECAEEIKEAERVREECRGWSKREIAALKARVGALERKHGWSITAACKETMTLTHLSDLQLRFQPTSFGPDATSATNAPISLSYIGDSHHHRPRPLTTSKRFFLQLLRAHLQCLSQSATSVPELLRLIQRCWTTASAVAEGVRRLATAFMVEERILSDERLAVTTSLLIPEAATPTKVRVSFELSVHFRDHEVDGVVGVKAETVYGERFNEGKMGEFLKSKQSGSLEGAENWIDSVVELQDRLNAKCKKASQ